MLRQAKKVGNSISSYGMEWTLVRLIFHTPKETPLECWNPTQAPVKPQLLVHISSKQKWGFKTSPRPLSPLMAPSFHRTNGPNSLLLTRLLLPKRGFQHFVHTLSPLQLVSPSLTAPAQILPNGSTFLRPTQTPFQAWLRVLTH